MPILLCAENKKNPSPDERLGEVTPEDVFILIRQAYERAWIRTMISGSQARPAQKRSAVSISNPLA